MKRINLIELFVLVVLSEPSAIAPMFPCLGSSSSSSSAPKESEPCIYGLNSLARVRPNGNRTWQNPRIYVEHYDDAAKFKYKLLGAYNELAFENSGRNTSLAFFYEKKIKIQAKDNNEDLYQLDFEEGNEANLVAESILSNDSARYKKCTGSNTYKLEKLYQTSTEGPLIDVGENLCIFKIPTSGATLFVIRRTAPTDDQPLTLCVFRSIDHNLVPIYGASARTELRLYWNHDAVQPSYVLETFTPIRLQEFFRPT